MGAITTTINGVSVSVYEGSFELDDSINNPSTIMFRVRDDLGTSHYTKGQPVSITDSVSGTQFTGFVTAAIEDRVSPQTLIKTDISGRDNTYLAQKRTYDGPEFTNVPAGVILCALLNVLSSEGVTAQYASDRDTTATDFNAGTLSSVVGASNLNDGDLELTPAGSAVTISEATTANFSTGSLSGVTAASNSLTPTATSAIKLVATCSQPGSTNAYTYVKVWNGNQTIGVSGATFSYDIFVLPSSPSGQMGVDVLFTDGTNWRDTASFSDGQSVFPHPKNDVGPMGVGAWYHRSFDWSTQYVGKTVQSVQVVCEGDAVGVYTGYFKNIQAAWTGPTIIHFMQNTTQQLSNNGYSSSVVSTVNTYDLTHGLSFALVGNATVFRTSSSYSIDAAKILQSSYVTWTAVEPPGTRFILAVSYDGGTIFQACTKNAPLPNLPPGANIAGKSLIFSEQFWYDPTITSAQQKASPEATPVLTNLQVTIQPSYSATKTDILYEIAQSADWVAGTFTNTTNNSGRELTLLQSIRNWDNGDASNQTNWGGAGVQVAPDRQAFHIAVPNTGTEGRSQLNFAGNVQDGTVEVDVLVDTANTTLGIVYRTTFWGNTDHTFAYVVQVDTANITLSRGSNNATPSLTSISSVALNISSGNWHRLKVVFVGSNHKVYLDDVLYINTIDATFLATGNIGLRCFNNTGAGYTAKFDNFGVIGAGAALTGQWVSANQSLAAATTYGTSVISWRDVSSDPGNTDTLLVETQVDGSTWQTAINGGPIPNLTAGQALAGVNLKVRVTLTTATASTLPSIDNLIFYVVSQYNSSGNRISPTLSLATITGRLGGSIVAWNSVLPSGCTLGVDTRIDAGAWTDQTAQNGQAVAGLNGQPNPTFDSFDANTSASYTNTAKSGGSVSTWTYDTTNSRIAASGGSGGLFIRSLP